VRLWTRALALTALLAPAVPAAAQQAPPPRVLIDVGGTVLGGGALGSTDATYITPTGQSTTLFSTSQSWSAGAGLIAHLQVRVKPRVDLELTGSWTRPEIRSKITGDFEGAADTTAASTVDQFLTSGGLVVSFARHGKWTPFARGAVSWLRHLSNDQTLYQDGISAELGGGIRYAWKEKRGHVKPYGLRADVWISARSGGLDLAQKSRVIAPGFSAALIFKL
jgi:hypothetical protein